MAVRRPVVVLALMLLVLPGLVLHALGKPITTMAHGPKGNVEFETLTLSANDFWDGVKTGRPVTISGELLLAEARAGCPPSSCRMAAAAWFIQWCGHALRLRSAHTESAPGQFIVALR